MKNKTNFREALPADAFMIASLHIRSWRVGYRGIIHQSYLDNNSDLKDRLDLWQKSLNSNYKTFLAFESSILVGFATIGQSQGKKAPEWAELYALYLDPEYFGRGVGKKLFTHVALKAVEFGYCKMCVNVLEDNKRGRNFYQRMGATLVEGSREYRDIGDLSYPEVRYEWCELGFDPQNSLD